MVVNPTAGKGRAASAGTGVLAGLRRAGHHVVDLSGPDADAALARAHDAVAGRGVPAGGVDALVVVGGDGMVHLGVQAVAGTDVPLGIVPVGTGNDFAATLGLPVRDPAAAGAAVCRALDAGVAGRRPVDAALATGPGLPDGPRWVAGAVSAGLDAAVNARANRLRHPRGSARYTIAAALELLHYRPWSYRLTFDGVADPVAAVAPAPSGPPGGVPPRDGARPGRAGAGLRLRPGPAGTATWTGRAALVTAANGPQIGGGIRVAPAASLDDGLLDVLVATDLSRPGAAVVFPSMFTGGHVRRRKVHVVRARAVTIEPGPDAWAADERALPVAHADGERLGPLPLRVEARARAVQVLVEPR
ncbi:diacylglycerol/lipid kinase family protein [Krasilnikoviella flava]|uniref:Diacylglycerol kinase (ATP) n=1 Tax=Krasilnikoviella flava TaxID=526729 RepID=A0A1T5L5X6_9MICO|nr:diacylglycerol kinase family protein [Krasilnikoviella flava]SKC71115.1 diacylglycerol kinase (ATP) [Krasilnikoviella flava]